MQASDGALEGTIGRRLCVRIKGETREPGCEADACHREAPRIRPTVTTRLLPIASKRTAAGDRIAIYRVPDGGLLYVPAIPGWRGGQTRRTTRDVGLWLDDSPL